MKEEEKVRNIREEAEALEKERIEKAKAEIEAVCQKYKVKLKAIAIIPAAEIKITLDSD